MAVRPILGRPTRYIILSDIGLVRLGDEVVPEGHHIGEHVLEAPVSEHLQDREKTHPLVGKGVFHLLGGSGDHVPHNDTVPFQLLQLKGEDPRRDPVDSVDQLVETHGLAIPG